MSELNHDVPPTRYKVKGKTDMLFANENSKNKLLSWIDDLVLEKNNT